MEVEVIAQELDNSRDTFKVSPEGFLYGMNLAFGLSFKPIPLAIGLGVDFYTGRQTYRDEEGDTSSLDVRRIYYKLPLAYQLSLPKLKGFFGVYPAYANYRHEYQGFKFDYGGFALGGFAKLYYSIGSIGLGGGIFLDYGLGIKGSEIIFIFPVTIRLNKVIHYGINFGLSVSW